MTPLYYPLKSPKKHGFWLAYRSFNNRGSVETKFCLVGEIGGKSLPRGTGGLFLLKQRYPLKEFVDLKIGSSVESQIKCLAKEWRKEICGKRSSEDLERKTMWWMQQTFILKTDSLFSLISWVWETMIFIEVDWDWWIRKEEFSSQLTGRLGFQEMLNVTSSSSQMLNSTSSIESLKAWLPNDITFYL